MNLRKFFLVAIGISLLSCDNDDYPYAEVPSVVLNEFWSQYPDASDAEFSELGKDYEVDFEVNKIDQAALISPSGELLKEKIEITWNDLPARVQKTLERDYGRRKIEDPEKIKVGEDIFYQVEVDRFFRNERLVMDASGNIETAMSYWK